MGKLITTGEKMTTLSVSQKVATEVTVQRTKLGLTTDNLLRSLLSMPLKKRRRGRPPVKKGGKQKGEPNGSAKD